MVLVDTTIWSAALRRRPRDLRPGDKVLVEAWTELVTDGTAALIGPIRQEILSGIRRHKVFEEIRRRLADFPHLPIEQEDYDQAARFFNQCRARGLVVVGSEIDMLICAVASRFEVPIFTTDADFGRYAKHLSIRLHEPGKEG